MTDFPNPQRGEVVGIINGCSQTLRLTLGSLASLEHALKSSNPDDTLLEMVQRMETGQIQASDILLILKAGLSGAGVQSLPSEIDVTGGFPAACRLAVQLLVTGFSDDAG